MDDAAHDLSAGERLFGGLLADAHLARAVDLPGLIARHGRAIGIRQADIYLADLQQVHLVPAVGQDQPPLPIDTTLPGRAFQQIEMFEQHDAGLRRLWLPLLDGTERLGVLGLSVESADAQTVRRCRRLASLVAELVTSKQMYGDEFIRRRRSQPMDLAAEIQWGLLPPLTFATPEVAIAGVLEPAYEVAGDSFDYAVDRERAHLAIFDAMGHGLTSALLASVAVSAYRNARRSGNDLLASVQSIEHAVAQQFGGERFVTAVVGDLDVSSGLLRWVNVGHLAPLLIRRGKVVKHLDCPPALPFGLGEDDFATCEEQLEPGDRMLFYTDGVTEARSPAGAFFGLDRLSDLVIRQIASGLSAPETMRRLTREVLAHQRGRLQDDATTLLVEWRTRDIPQLTL